MRPATRNLWIELAAICLVLLSLLLLLVSSYHLSMFVVHRLLPNQEPLRQGQVILGLDEFLVAILGAFVPALGTSATAWALRVLLVDEEETEP